MSATIYVLHPLPCPRDSEEVGSTQWGTQYWAPGGQGYKAAELGVPGAKEQLLPPPLLP